MATRREFLTVAGLGIAAGAVLLDAPGEIKRRVVESVEQQWDAWERSNVTNDQFLSRYQTKLKNLNIGSSFDPHQVDFLYWEEDKQHRLDNEDRVNHLRRLREEYGITETRLGMRWENSIAPDGTFLLTDYYKPIVNYCNSAGLETTINTGTKSQRDPEFFVPKGQLKGGLPAVGSVIKLDSEIGQKSQTFFASCLDTIKTLYGDASFNWQPDNEPFYKFAGLLRWTLDQDYVAAMVRQAANAFPRSQILVNSMGLFDIPEVITLFRRLLAEEPKLQGRLVSGIDYYYKMPESPAFPVIGKIDFSPLFRQVILDVFAMSRIQTGKNIGLENVQLSRELGYSVETTEDQTEPWKDVKSPGNSAREFKYTLLRCMDNHAVDLSKKSLIRIWGAERLAKDLITSALSDDQRQILELARDINRLS